MTALKLKFARRNALKLRVLPVIRSAGVRDDEVLKIVNNLGDVENVQTAWDNLKQNATETRTGVVELATTAEAQAGTDTARAVTAAGLKAAAEYGTFTPVGTGAVATTIRAKCRQIVSVLDYIPTALHAGILAGTNTTDTAPYEQAAVDYLGSLGGGVLAYPFGTYYGGPVFIPYDNVEIRLERATLKLKDSPSSNQFGRISAAIQSNKTTIVEIGNFKISGGAIDGNKANQLNGSTESDGVNAGVFVYACARATVEDMVVHDCDGYGISFPGTDAAGRSDFLVRRCTTYDNSYDGLDVKGGTTNRPTRVWIEDLYSYGNGGGATSGREATGCDIRGQYISGTRIHAYDNANAGIRIRALYGYDCSLDDCVSVGNGYDGFQIMGLANEGPYVLKSCRSEDNGVGASGSGFRIEQGPADLIGCTSLRNGSHGVRNTDTAATINIIGGSCSNNVTDGVYVTAGSDVTLAAGVRIVGNGRDGVRFSGRRLDADVVTIKNNGTTTAGSGVVLIGGSMSGWSVRGSTITDDQGTKTQAYAVVFSTTPPAGVLVGNYLTGNATGVVSGTVPSGTIRRDNIGYITQGRYETSALDVTTTGVKSATNITHGLSVTPAAKDVSVSIARSANNVSWNGTARLSGVSSSVIATQLVVSSASGTGGDTATLLVQVDSTVAP